MYLILLTLNTQRLFLVIGGKMIKNIILSLILSISSTNAMHLKSLIQPTITKYLTRNFKSQMGQTRPGIITALIAFAGTTLGYNSYVCTAEESVKNTFPEFEKFVQKFTPPKDAQVTIKKNESAVAYSTCSLIKGFPANYTSSHIDGTPDLYIKGSDINRIINAERFRECIKRNNLTKVAVPHKYICKAYGRWKVVAQNIDTDLDGINQLTFEQVQELVTITEQTGYRDWKVANIIIDTQGIINFIDLEDRSFLGENPEIIRTHYGDNPYNKAAYIYDLYDFVSNKYGLDKTTQVWLKERENYWHNCPEGLARHNPLPLSTEFDSADIDFEKVKQEFAEMDRMY